MVFFTLAWAGIYTVNTSASFLKEYFFPGERRESPSSRPQTPADSLEPALGPEAADPSSIASFSSNHHYSKYRGCRKSCLDTPSTCTHHDVFDPSERRYADALGLTYGTETTSASYLREYFFHGEKREGPSSRPQTPADSLEPDLVPEAADPSSIGSSSSNHHYSRCRGSRIPRLCPDMPSTCTDHGVLNPSERRYAAALGRKNRTKKRVN
uniref:Uncharacterized protein n=1 Tax=Knipowitschia caucasica TaxID=637954 RepID=A0AAV2JRP7_KNICA